MGPDEVSVSSPIPIYSVGFQRILSTSLLHVERLRKKVIKTSHDAAEKGLRHQPHTPAGCDGKAPGTRNGGQAERGSWPVLGLRALTLPRPAALGSTVPLPQPLLHTVKGL